ncbi:hypothetical protein N9C01_02950 [bacterium]|nr:hypothetical protein [bacterium]
MDYENKGRKSASQSKKMVLVGYLLTTLEHIGGGYNGGYGFL